MGQLMSMSALACGAGHVRMDEGEGEGEGDGWDGGEASREEILTLLGTVESDARRTMWLLEAESGADVRKKAEEDCVALDARLVLARQLQQRANDRGDAWTRSQDGGKGVAVVMGSARQTLGRLRSRLVGTGGGDARKGR